jgi:two-component system, NtrC family, response regulator AtoC
MPCALIIDDDRAFTSAVAGYIELEGFSVATADSLGEAREFLGTTVPDLLLVDLMLPDGNGLELIPELPADSPTRIVVITGHASLDAAIESVRASRVVDFLIKPIDVGRLKACIQAVGEVRPAFPDAVGSDSVAPSAALAELVGESSVMQDLRRLVVKVAPTDATVLLQGESGTGKDLIARAIHQLSPRRDRRYFAINCGAVSPQLIGTELFGHEKGSFTGATRQHRGHFERTSGGTLFLDELTEMPPDLQVQLLRVLETGAIVRIGGDTEIPVDVRLIAATNRDPQQAIAEGRLREDLYFRLMVFPIEVPPLRERAGDIARLAHGFLAELNRRHSANKQFDPDVLAALEAYPWPGNVRELRNVVQRAFILADESIDKTHLANLSASLAPTALAPTAGTDALNLVVGTTIEDAERRLLLATLAHYEGDKPRAAEALGISLKTLYNRLKQYGSE